MGPGSGSTGFLGFREGTCAGNAAEQVRFW